MIYKDTPLTSGLYLVSTPIGNARDITLRALDVLANADVIAAEDTRTARKLMDIHGVPTKGRKFVAYHDHSGAGARGQLSDAIKTGQSVAYVSEAGTPLLADPGYKLAAEIRAAGGMVTAVPGPSALLTAAAVGGLPTDRLYFVGFLPASQAARRSALTDLKDVDATLVIYESPRRVRELLSDMCELFEEDRQVAVCRELTKKFEDVQRGTVAQVMGRYSETAPKGEIVILVERGPRETKDAGRVQDALREALQTMRVRDAADAVAGALGLSRRDVYQLALQMKDEGDHDD